MGRIGICLWLVLSIGASADLWARTLSCEALLRGPGEASALEISNAFPKDRLQGEVFVLTHQLPKYQAQTARFLQTEGHDFPRLFLASPSFPLLDSFLLAEVGFVERSNGGEFSSALNADIVHLGGGDFFGCLRRTVFDVIDRALAYPTRKKVRIILHADLIYDGSHTLDWATREMPQAVADEAEDYLRDRQNPGVRLLLLRSHSDDEGFHYDFVRDSDRKLVELVATYPRG